MAENNFSLQKTLTMLLDEKKYHSLRDILSTMNPADIAAIFDELDQARLPLLFRLEMVSLSMPVRRMRRMASSTVMFGRRDTYSVVMIEPAESSG